MPRYSPGDRHAAPETHALNIPSQHSETLCPHPACSQRALLEVPLVFSDVFFPILVTDQQDSYPINRRNILKNKLITSVGSGNRRDKKAEIQYASPVMLS